MNAEDRLRMIQGDVEVVVSYLKAMYNRGGGGGGGGYSSSEIGIAQDSLDTIWRSVDIIKDKCDDLVDKGKDIQEEIGYVDNSFELFREDFSFMSKDLEKILDNVKSLVDFSGKILEAQAKQTNLIVLALKDLQKTIQSSNGIQTASTPAQSVVTKESSAVTKGTGEKAVKKEPVKEEIENFKAPENILGGW